jgi:hypothetical protein
VADASAAIIFRAAIRYVIPHLQSSAELFNPTTGNWSRTSLMSDGHAGHTATLLNAERSSSRIVKDDE